VRASESGAEGPTLWRQPLGATGPTLWRQPLGAEGPTLWRQPLGAEGPTLWRQPLGATGPTLWRQPLGATGPTLWRQPLGAEGPTFSSSAQVDDHDAAVRIIVVVLIFGGAAQGTRIEGQLQSWLVLFSTLAFPLLSLPYLLDDEGRQHRRSSVAGQAALPNCAPRLDRGHLPIQSDFSNVTFQVKLWRRAFAPQVF